MGTISVIWQFLKMQMILESAVNERKNFILRTAIFIGIVIFIFSFVLNRYFLKPIKNLVSYTKIIREKSKRKNKYK